MLLRASSRSGLQYVFHRGNSWILVRLHPSRTTIGLLTMPRKDKRWPFKIVGTNPEEQQKMFGRHFDIEDELVSKISRRSIDILKANFRNDLSVEDWRLVKNLKTLFKIQ